LGVAQRPAYVGLVGDGEGEAPPPLRPVLKGHRDVEAHGCAEGVGSGHDVGDGLRGCQQRLAERAAGRIAVYLHRVGFGSLENHNGRGIVRLVVGGRDWDAFAGAILGGKRGIERVAQDAHVEEARRVLRGVVRVRLLFAAR
jgi:hypothetical protein